MPSQLAWNVRNCVGKFYYHHYLIVIVHQCPRVPRRARGPCAKCNIDTARSPARSFLGMAPSAPHSALVWYFRRSLWSLSLHSIALPLEISPLSEAPQRDRPVGSSRQLCSEAAAVSATLWQSVPGSNHSRDMLYLPFACHPHAVSQAVRQLVVRCPYWFICPGRWALEAVACVKQFRPRVEAHDLNGRWAWT